MLWKIEGTQLALLGSVHVLDVPVLPLSDAAWRAFNSATRVVFEHNFGEQPDLSFARLPPGQSLSTVIPPELFRAVQDRCREYSVNVEFVSAHQPWLGALSLGTAMAKHAGLTHDAGVDTTLWKQARENGKAIEFLEDTLAALRGFSIGPVEEQLTMLRFTAVEHVAGLALMKRLVAGWKQRQADVVLACAQEQRALTPAIFGSVIEGRSRGWLPRLRALAEEDGHQTLAVVGASHTVGPAGLPGLLRAAGYNVTAVDVSGE